ncbi:Vps5 C terminal like-domain-containing protein [Blastocladiella britannica]|nr:Vps5 C terminal like-domain-containing protein [Blastocladiella britannica]
MDANSSNSPSRMAAAGTTTSSSSSPFHLSGHLHDDPLLGNPFGMDANPFADLPSSSSNPSIHSPATITTTAAAATTTSTEPTAVASGGPRGLGLVDPNHNHDNPLAAAPPAAPEPTTTTIATAPSVQPLAPIVTSIFPGSGTEVPQQPPIRTPTMARGMGSAAAIVPAISALASTGAGSPSLRRSLSQLAVADPLHDPLANPLTAAVGLPVSAASTRAMYGSPLSHPPATTSTVHALATPLDPALSRPLPPPPPPLTAAASVSESPVSPLAASKVRGPMSYSQAQLLAPSLAASPFEIRVNDPVKIGDAISPYVVYKVVTKTTASGFKSESSVSRRYSDFLWLSQRLASSHLGIVVPGLPEKQALGRFQDDFIESRRVGLQLFLRKVAAHPLLGKDEAFRLFLEVDAFKEQIVDEKPPTAPPKGKMREIDPWFEERREKLEDREMQLKTLFKSVDQLSGAIRDVATAHFEFGETMSMLAEIEDPGPHGMAGRLEKLGNLHKRARDIVFAMAALDLGHMEHAIEDQLRTISAIHASMQLRSSAYNNWQALDVSMHKRMGTMAKSRFEQPALKAEVDALQAQVTFAQTAFDTISRTLRSEIERLEIERVHELSIAVQAMVSAVHGHQQSMVNLWEDYLDIMRAGNL